MESRQLLKPYQDDGVILLENGLCLEGTLFGNKDTIAFGELCFNTSMTGVEEILTDPSYTNQIVVMTYPEQGNTGINFNDHESDLGFCASSVVVHSLTHIPSNYESKESLEDFLVRHNKVGIYGVDTRLLTLMIRNQGALHALIISKEKKENLLKEQGLDELFKKFPSYGSEDLILKVSTKKTYVLNEEGKKTIVVYDFGVKKSLLNNLISRGAKLIVVPANTSAEEVLRLNPDGVFLSNGPGDPQVASYAVESIKKIIGKKPIFGVCMGHQLLALALGGKTKKMKFGHRGGNQPVLNLSTKKVEISSHNHGYEVDFSSLPSGVRLTHVNLNDGCCEGIDFQEKKVFSVQYHPEGAPGPHDSKYLFDKFMDMINTFN
jgi:carbamoyl-phosphate synthase small subunit